MKTLLKNGTVINVFTGELERTEVLLEDGRIAGTGDYSEEDADDTEDISGKYLCPGFIDGHIHIESSMLLPAEFARAALPHGTTAVVADPHEIANVCGSRGIEFMLEASEGLPLMMYFMIPSCVPSTEFDEAGACLEAEDIRPFYDHPRVLGLGEVMSYHAAAAGDRKLREKIDDAEKRGLAVNGHAPLLSGRMLDRYIAAGVGDDHECSSAEEAMERIRKGQRVMIRQGTAARNLKELLPLFEEPFAGRCLLVTDDKHPADLLKDGHIDHIIRQAAAMGKNPVTGIRMATIQAAEYYGLRRTGAVAPGYQADLLVLDDLERVLVRDVYQNGRKVVSEGRLLPFPEPEGKQELTQTVLHSFRLRELEPEDFLVKERGVCSCRVIGILQDQLLTEERVRKIDFDRRNGIDTGRDLIKTAVIERHRNTGHTGLGFIEGTGIQYGAIASSVSHDSHNLIVMGADEKDMAFAANRIRSLGGGMAVVRDGKVEAEMPLPYAGLMTDRTAAEAASQNEQVRAALRKLGVPENRELFMTTAFVSLPVIPHLKLTTRGLVDVDRQKLVPLITG